MKSKVGILPFLSRKHIIRVVLAFLVLGTFFSTFSFIQPTEKAHATTPWYNHDWSYRKAITVDNIGNASALIDYQVKVTLNSTNFDFSKTKTDGSDIRFTDSDEITLINYWFENYDSTEQVATIWIKVPSVPASSSKTIYLYYGNINASSTSSGRSTFSLFDDFENGDTVATYQNTPTYDGSGQAVHPSVVYFADGWQGYKYWMAMTPYPNGNDSYENPSILASNDGSSWKVPSGLTNPLIAKPASGHNDDSDMIYNDDTNELWLYYLESGGAGGTNLKLLTSSDGVTWSAARDILNVPNYQITSPAIYKDGSIYYMWYVDSGSSGCAAANTTVRYRTSFDGVTWSAAQVVSLSQPGYNVWHIDVTYVPTKNEYWALFNAYPSGSTCGHTVLFYGKSSDGLNWTTYGNIALNIGSAWDSTEIYRSTLLYDADSDLLRVWYSAAGSGHWHIGYTEANYTEFLASGIFTRPPIGWQGNLSSASVNDGILTFTSVDGNWQSLYSPQTFGSGYALRSRAKFISHPVAGGSDLGFRGTHYIRFSESNDAIKTIAIYDGTMVGSQNQTGFVVGSYAIWDILRETNRATFKVNGNELTNSPITTHVPSDSLPIRFYSRNSTFYMDWVLVRQYSVPEPSTSLKSEDPFTLPSLTVQSAGSITTNSASIESVTTTTHPWWLRLFYGTSRTTAPSSASFTTIPADLSAVEIGQEITFDASSSGSNIVSYEWNFGDGTIANGVKVEHKYDTPGLYTATLTTTNKSGNTTGLVLIIMIGFVLYRVRKNRKT